MTFYSYCLLNEWTSPENLVLDSPCEAKCYSAEDLGEQKIQADAMASARSHLKALFGFLYLNFLDPKPNTQGFKEEQ